MKRDTFSLDIETINTVTDPDFTEPAHWTIFAVAIGHRAPTGETEVEVLFRQDHTVSSEGDLIEDMVSWIAERSNHADREILTYNGQNYDLPILQYRSKRIDDVEPGVNVEQRLSLLLDTSDHVDLIEDMRELKGAFVSLDESLNEFNIGADEPEWMGETVEGSDMPSMGLELLSGRENSDLREVVRRYAASDVQPLFVLKDALVRKPEP